MSMKFQKPNKIHNSNKESGTMETYQFLVMIFQASLTNQMAKK